jgi:hypothetical protein
VTELPHYPTPYELWKKAHEVPPPKPKKKYTSEERARIAEDVTRRLLNHQRKEHFSMMKTQHKKLAAELRGLTFAPNLKSTSRVNNKLVHNYEPLYKRYAMEIEKANIKRTKMEQQCRTNEMVDCTFEPDIASSNKKYDHIFDDAPPVEERCIKYGVDRHMWAEQRREIMKRVEDKQLTFAPHITERSRELFDRMIREGRAVKPEDRAKTYVVTGDSRDPGHEEDLFAPIINHRSLRKKMEGSVFDRLYNKAMEKEKKRREFEYRYLDEHVRNVAKPLSACPRNIDDSYEGFALSGVERSELRERRQGAVGITRRRSAAEGVKPGSKPAREYTNVVEWNPKLSFMAPRLGL